MTKKEIKEKLEHEIKEKLEHEIMWELKFAIDEIESETQYRWYIQDCCQKIQGMLSVAKALNLLNYDDWSTCMKMINGLCYCYEGRTKTDVSYKYW